MAAGAERQHAGNEGYDDQPDSFYSWDDTVAHHADLAVGDPIALWDKVSLIGVSVIDRIDKGANTKVVRKCPNCHRSSIKRRSSMRPAFRCYSCHREFEAPIELVKPVRTYRAIYEASWVDLGGALNGSQLRRVCESPQSQQSLRPLNWSQFILALQEHISPRVSECLTEPVNQALASEGHREVLTRARRGQSQFRGQLIDKYGSSCALTGPTPLVTLEAAHLYSYAEYGVHQEHGGLLLRRDIHRLFDRGDIAIHPERLTVDADVHLLNFRHYSGLHGLQLTVEMNSQHRSWVRKHWAQHRRQGPRHLVGQ